MAQVRTIRGKRYRLVVLHVQESDRYGRPKRATVLYEEESLNIQGGEEFVTAFIPEDVAGKRAN